MVSSATDGSAGLALVTGASSGIGRSLAGEFARHGFDLVVVADDDAIRDAASSLEAEGRAVHAVQADLSTEAGVDAVHEAVTALARPVTAAALNAGAGTGGPFAENDLADDLRVVDLNVRSTVHLAKLLVRDMLRAGEGRLLFTSSIAARLPGPWYATYAASKAFVQSFAEALRHELRDTGVSVTALMPGPTDTEFFERADMVDTRVGQGSKDDPDDVARTGFEALMAGKDHVVAGSAKNAVMAAGSRVMPETARAALHAQMTRAEDQK
jgi:short-subunit dehydrogenase